MSRKVLFAIVLLLAFSPVARAEELVLNPHDSLVFRVSARTNDGNAHMYTRVLTYEGMHSGAYIYREEDDRTGTMRLARRYVGSLRMHALAEIQDASGQGVFYCQVRPSRHCPLLKFPLQANEAWKFHYPISVRGKRNIMGASITVEGTTETKTTFLFNSTSFEALDVSFTIKGKLDRLGDEWYATASCRLSLPHGYPLYCFTSEANQLRVSLIEVRRAHPQVGQPKRRQK